MKVDYRDRMVFRVVGCAVILSAGSVWAGDVKWTGAAGVREDGTYAWGDPSNWGGTLPGEGDVAWIQNVTGAPDPMRISMDGETQTIGSLKYSNTPKAIVENGKLRLALGSVYGNMGGYGVSADIEQLVDGLWYNDDSYGKTLRFMGNISGEGAITFAGNQNRSVRFEKAQISVPKITHRAAGFNFYPGSRLRGTELEVNGSFADGNFNGTGVTIDLQNDAELSAAEALVFDQEASLTFAGSGGAFTYTRPQATVDQRFALSLKGGKAALKIYGGTAAGNYLTVTNFTRVAGTYMSVDGSGLRLPTLANGASGFVGPWLWNATWFPMKVTDEAGTLVAATEKDCEQGFPSDGGRVSTLIRTTDAAEYTMDQDTSIFWLWDTHGSDKTFNLGEHTLHVYGALAHRWSGGTKTYNAEGAGKIVFHGDDIIIAAAGGGCVDLQAPIAWDAESSNCEYPSLVLLNGNKTAGDGVLFSGKDEIGHYGNINGALLAHKLVFAGPSDRTIHGSIQDTLHIEQRGTGTLTFEGTSELQTRWFKLSATKGKIVMKSANIGASAEVSENGIYELAEGVTMTQIPKISNGGTYQGFGTTAWGVRDGRFLKGGVIAPGNETKAGTLTMGGLKPEGDFTLVCRIDTDSNGKVAFTKNSKLTLLTTAMIGTIRVDDLTNRGRNIKLTDEFTVVDYSQGGVENATTHGIAWQVTTGTPKCFDVSAAEVRLDTTNKRLVVSGIKTIGRGLTIVIH